MATALALGATGLAGATPARGQATTTLSIAVVDNVDTERLRALADAFTDANPDIALEWVTDTENLLRQQVSTDVATGAGKFDVVTVGAYEVPIWAERGWLRPLDQMPADYNVDDLIPSIRGEVSYDNQLYAAPFYGEAAFTMYRTDLFQQAGFPMSEQPTWADLAGAARVLNTGDTSGICLRGKPGWGENVALVTAMANSFGARWFDENWQAQLTSPEWTAALDTYVQLLRDYGPSNAAELGYQENLDRFRQGGCAIWVDSTAAASAVTDANTSSVAQHVGFAPPPRSADAPEGTPNATWLWSWSLGIARSSKQPEAAARFVAWATSPQYSELVAQHYGWAQVPPGTRASLYANPWYLASAPFAPLVYSTIQAANPDEPTAQPVPYRGIQYVGIPQFPGIGTAVGARFALAVSGQISPAEALDNAQWVTGRVLEHSEFIAQD